MKAPKSELISRAGAYYSGYALSMSGIIFRETSSTDVGIDGQIELVDEDGSATGMLAGIQIKSGDSFVDHKQQKFTFKSSKEHYKYWSNLTIPTLGIVFSPKLKAASWFILEAHAEKILKNSGSCSITQKLNNYNKLDFETSSGKHISDYIRKYYNRSITEEELDNFDSLKSDANSKSTTDKSDFEVSEEKMYLLKKDSEINKLFYSKHESWKNESEWRTTSYRSRLHDYPAKLLSITFGLNTPDAGIEYVKDVMKNSNVLFKYMVADRDNFKIYPVCESERFCKGIWTRWHPYKKIDPMPEI